MNSSIAKVKKRLSGQDVLFLLEEARRERDAAKAALKIKPGVSWSQAAMCFFLGVVSGASLAILAFLPKLMA